MTMRQEDDEKPMANIFQIVDSIVENLDRRKKLVVIVLIAIVASVPLLFHLTAFLTSPPYSVGPARLAISLLLILEFVIVGMR